MNRDITIGQALKEERDILGISQQKFCGNIITRSAYAKVERGERKIGADILVKLLFQNKIDISNFFDKLKIHYQSDNDQKADKLMEKIKIAFDNHQIEDVKKCEIEILKLNGYEILKLRAMIAVGYLTNNINVISKTIQAKLFKELDKRENWFEDVEAIRLLTNAMPMLNNDQLNYFMYTILEKYSTEDNLSEIEQERLAILCDNFVLSCYERNIYTETTKAALKYLLDLDRTPHLLIYRISGMYDSALLKDDKKKKEKIRNFMQYFGYEKIIKNWK